MSEILLQRAATAGQEARRTVREDGEHGRTGAAAAGSAAAPSRAMLVDLAALPAGQPMLLSEEGMPVGLAAPDAVAEVFYRDDLDAEAVRRLALRVKQQLSLQALSIANAHAMGFLGMVREISLM